MKNNFTIEIMAGKDGRIISLGTSDAEIYIYQLSEGKSVRVFEISCKEECTDPGGKRLITECEQVYEAGVQIRTDDHKDSLSSHSYKYGEEV